MSAYRHPERHNSVIFRTGAFTQFSLMDESVDVVIIGAGVVGLAVARELAQNGREVIVLEHNPRVGEETSSRNSEVIHAGIYYPTHSVKARLCVRGKQMLYRYCDSKGVPYRRCGKLMIALDERQDERLSAILDQGKVNGVDDLERLTSTEISELEPEVRCSTAAFSPSTGILDTHNYMLALQGDLEAAGGSIAFLSECRGGSIEDGGIELTVRSDNEETSIRAATVVNAAGLRATEVADAIAGLDDRHVPRTHLAKGTYFVLQQKSPFTHLVYPMPDGAWLGVHVTLDIAGQTRFGPDQEWVDEVDYRPDPKRARSFYEAIRKYWPAIPADSLAPGYVGVRPKIVGPGEPPGDFVIQGPAQHGVDGLINLFGIESPGLTSSLAIGEEVARLLQDASDSGEDRLGHTEQ
jgi:L-2-hydroxyglutarate oxidase LhgO